MRVSIESVVLVALCAADAVFTVWLIATGRATEGNALLGFYLKEGGMLSFLGAKTLLTLGPIAILEQIRRRHPRFVRLLLRAGIAAYVLAWSAGVYHLNWR